MASLRALLAAVALLASTATWAEWQLSGKVIRVADGDTLTLLDAQQVRHAVRLSDIDAPEISHGKGRPGQPFSARARHALAEMTLGKQAQASCHERDARTQTDGSIYVRNVCTLNLGGTNPAHELLDRGLAMAARQNMRYIRDDSTHMREARAQAQRIGLWSLRTPVPPWEWRSRCWQRGECSGHDEGTP